MTRLFGTDGIRGTTSLTGTGTESLRLTPRLALRIGQAIGQLTESDRSERGKGHSSVIVGRDPRISGMMLESAIAAGLLGQGVDVVQLGVAPTPAVAYLTRRMSARFGIIISASHNPVEDNGIKIFGSEGYKLDSDSEERIEEMVLDPGLAFTPCDTRELGRLRAREHLLEVYVDHLVQSWRGERDLSGLFVILECANGATSHVAPEVFRRLGAEVEVVSGTPDGLNINQSYEYINPEQFGELVTQKRADLGAAFDGDGDRVILIDECGETVDGDVILAILGRHLLAGNGLPGDRVVATNMSNYGLHDSLKEVGIEVVETRVGDRFVLQEMLASGCILGGERSGHILLLDEEQTTGDGIYTALAVAGAMVGQDASLSELASVIHRYPQFIESADVPPEKPPLKGNREVEAVIKQLQDSLGPHVDINLRYSGTEDKVRLSIRGRKGDSSSLIRDEGRKALERIAQITSAQARRDES